MVTEEVESLREAFEREKNRKEGFLVATKRLTETSCQKREKQALELIKSLKIVSSLKDFLENTFLCTGVYIEVLPDWRERLESLLNQIKEKVPEGNPYVLGIPVFFQFKLVFQLPVLTNDGSVAFNQKEIFVSVNSPEIAPLVVEVGITGYGTHTELIEADKLKKRIVPVSQSINAWIIDNLLKEEQKQEEGGIYTLSLRSIAKSRIYMEGRKDGFGVTPETIGWLDYYKQVLNNTDLAAHIFNQRLS